MSPDKNEGWGHNMNIDNTSFVIVLYASLPYKTP